MTNTWNLSGFGDEIDADPKIQLSVLAALGARHIEVRSAWDVNVVEMTSEQLGTFAGHLKDQQMAVSAIASPVGKVDIADSGHEVERLRRAIDAAHRLESQYIRIFSFYRGAGVTVESIRDTVLSRMASFAALAAREGVVLLHENEKDIYGDIPSRVCDIIESVGSDALRIAWDNANYVQVGIRPFTDGFALLRPYLEYLQVKDALAGTGQVVPAGEGDGQLAETIAALAADGYAGFASLEPHLAIAHGMGGFSGPAAFGRAARAFAALTADAGVVLV